MRALTPARTAGLLYLLVVVTGIFSLGIVPSRTIVAGDPAATLVAIRAHEALFRWGIAAFLVKQVAFLLLPFALYRVLHDVHRGAAVAMVALAVVSVPIALLSLAHRIDLLALLGDPWFSTHLDAERLQAAAATSLAGYRDGMLVTNLFWGLWLFPFGWLVWRSGRIPRVLGLFLMVGCLGYLVEVFGTLLLPGYAETTLARFALKPAGIGEIGACLWLVVAGARAPEA